MLCVMLLCKALAHLYTRTCAPVQLQGNPPFLSLDKTMSD